MSKGFREWKQLYQRLLAMSSPEITDRLGQQVTARADFLRYRVGLSFEHRSKIDPASAAPNFFFSPEAVPRLCSQLRELFPNESREIIQRAEKICRHRFDLLGYKDLNYGQEIDWHLDAIHGKRAPRKPGFRIRYLDFNEVGDSKVTWELSRHQHLVTLAKAFRLSGEAKFADELFQQWRHWQRENPYPIGIHWASSLEVAFRSLSWLWVYHLMLGSSAMPADFRSELLGKLAISGRHIERYLSTYFSPNTHLLGEGAALFFIGTLCPELPAAMRWQRRGWGILREAAERQVRPDGLHFEQSIYYHVYALDFFLHAWVLASRNEVSVPDQFRRTVERMLESLCILGQAGPVPRLGDDDGGRLFDPQRNRTEHLLDPLATGAVLFHRADFKHTAAGFREESLWLLGESGASEFDRLADTAPAKGSTAFKDSGLYILSDSDRDRQLVIDAGPHGADSAGHGHADALSIVANAGGQPLLIDPGTFEYVGQGADRNRFRGTRAHNTLMADGLDQAEPKRPFSWESLPNVSAERWVNGETFDYFVGSHDGYTRLPEPVVHRRSVFSRKSHFWLVRDQALGKGIHRLDLHWHLAPGFVSDDHRADHFHNEKIALSIFSSANHVWSQEVLPEDWSPAYGQKQDHPLLHLGTTAQLPAEIATVIIPTFSAVHMESPVAASLSTEVQESAVCYHLKIDQQEHWLYFGRQLTWNRSPWRTDAEFLYWSQSRADSTDRTLVCCNASFVDASGKNVVSSPSRLSSCEIISIDGKPQMIASDQDVKIDFETFNTISLDWKST